MLIFLLNLFYPSFSLCPKFSCGSYSTHLCSVFYDDFIELSPCLIQDVCDITKLYSKWEEGSTGLECEPQSSSVSKDSIEELMQFICKSPVDAGKKLVQTHPKQCSSNNDCGLTDGSFAECKCGLSVSGFSYCEVSEGDEIALKVHDAACGSNEELFVSVLLYKEFYVYLQDRPVCAGFVFDDIAAIDYLHSGGSLLEIQMLSYSILTSISVIFMI